MGKIRFSVHPLFFVVGLYYIVKNELLVFIIYSLTAVLHEMGHSIVSGNLGYRLNKITLMPFGAVACGNIDGLKLIDEIKIALAGPLLNIAIALFFVSFWWIFPETYAYTDTVVMANLSMALINFIPAYPLDGGRVLSAILGIWLNKEKAHVICKVIGIILSAILFALFVVSIFFNVNVTILLFALFTLFGAMTNAKENKYILMYSLVDKENLMKGVPCKKQAVDENITIKKLIGVLDSSAINEVIVFSEGKVKAVLNHNRILGIIEKGDIYAKLAKYI